MAKNPEPITKAVQNSLLCELGLSPIAGPANNEQKEMEIMKLDKSGFTDNLLEALSSSNGQGQKFICSPLSIQSALTVAMCGARKNTLKEMMCVLYPNVSGKDITADAQGRSLSIS